jgi:DNA-binding LacI/PurR family transcriptional regulator
MANQNTKVFVAAPTFMSVLHTALCEHLKKLLGPKEIVIRSVTGEPDEQKLRLEQALGQIQPSALIAMDIRPDQGTIAAYRAANIPIILLNEETLGLSTISVDNIMGGRLAGEYLVSNGRKKIAIVSGRTKIEGGLNAEQRLNGFLQAMSAAGLSVPQGGKIEVAQYTREDGIEVMPKLLEIGVDAIFCAAGDNTAIGLLSVARERGVRIPETVAIMGFDDLFIAQVSTPKLTTVRQPLKEMADAAYKLAVTQKIETLLKPQKIVFKPEIVVRQSA